MSRNIKEYLNRLWKSVLFWTFAVIFFAIIRYYAIDEELGIQIETEYSNVYAMQQLILTFGFGGFLIGILYATIDFVFEKFISKRMPIGLNILLQTILIFMSVIAISSLLIKLSSRIHGFPFDIKVGWWYRDRSFWPALFYIPFASFVFSLIIIVSDKFGKGVFFKILVGKYKNPKEERRIFMFLDLKSSTAIAEQLGHFEYSQLIQDCFYDLNEVISKYDAEIYQYVGDEAVLSWSYTKGVAGTNCLHLFFDFQDKIRIKAPFYMKKYGMIPEFKAGLHGGNVMVSEVGAIKKELAYHGDVVNTTARIQGECNRYRVPILISEKLLADLGAYDGFQSKFMGSVLLKGKLKEIKIHTILYSIVN